MLTQNLSTGVSDGLFVAAYELLRGTDIPNYHRENLYDLVDWFRKNLKVPNRLNSTSSKGWKRRNPKGISWYKDTAHEHISKMREISTILRDLGVNVSERSTLRPGYIVYEDEHQVVAEPFSENV
ncbi:MAG: hypothetical protein K8F90_16350 [Hyphomicrobiales bacterium]|nr:hypothetical protein [Hyphomicrobiales bacterium]